MADDAQDAEAWRARVEALGRVQADFDLLHRLVLAEIGHPLPPEMADFLRDWLDTARHVALKRLEYSA